MVKFWLGFLAGVWAILALQGVILLIVTGLSKQMAKKAEG